MSVTQLDQATTAAVMLAQVIGGSGDKFALLSYGRRVQQQLLPGNGPVHLRTMINLLSQARSEAAEANHLQAASRLKNLQRRRGLGGLDYGDCGERWAAGGGKRCGGAGAAASGGAGVAGAS